MKRRRRLKRRLAQAALIVLYPARMYVYYERKA